MESAVLRVCVFWEMVERASSWMTFMTAGLAMIDTGSVIPRGALSEDSAATQKTCRLSDIY